MSEGVPMRREKAADLDLGVEQPVTKQPKPPPPPEPRKEAAGRPAEPQASGEGGDRPQRQAPRRSRRRSGSGS